MTTNTKKPTSPFGLAALALDAEFHELERVARELERLSINSDRGLDRALALLGEADSCRVRMSSAMQELSRTLEEARARNELAAKQIAERATVVQERQQEAGQLFERFKVLGEMVKQVTTGVAMLGRTDGGLSAEERSALITRMPAFNDQLGVLVEEARKLMDDAHGANLKSLERNADSLRQSLQAARHRLGQLAGRGAPGPGASDSPSASH